MAAQSSIARSRPADDRPARTGSTPASTPNTTVATGGIALACAAAGLAIAQAYPIAPLVVLAAFVAWSAFAFVRFSFALPAMLALLPVVGFAPTTGWLTFEELDLLILAGCAGGYAALCARSMSHATPGATARSREPGHGPALSIFSIVLIALFLVSSTVALLRGIEASGGFRFDWTQGYVGPLNSVRIFKSFGWALLIAPLLRDELRRPGGFDRLGLGMTGALGLVGLAVLRERLAFVGLLDFSDDYRVTAPFWEMHVGGAALDGFLALTIPFAVRDALRHPVAESDGRAIGDFERARMIVAWLVLALAAYACLVTFSRGVYAAVPLSMLLLVVLVFRQRLRLDRRALWPLLAKGALLAALVAGCSFGVFRAGGYRAVLAVFAVLAVGVPVEASIRQSSIGTWLVAAVVAAVAGLAGFLVAQVLPKGPYLVFGLALVVSVAAIARVAAHRAPRSSATIPRSLAMPAIAAWLWLALCAGLVALNWGGARAARDSALVLGALIALSFAASRLPRAVWPEQRREQVATIGFAALVMGSVAVFSAGAYMGGRFSASRGDLDLRIAHWTEGIGRLRGADDWLLGKGLGRFPATSLFESGDGTVPGGFRVDRRDGERFLALTTPKLRYMSFDEFFRVSQRVSVQPRTTYVVTAQVRSPIKANLHVELCEKQLLYHGNCVDAERTASGEPGWQTLTFPLFSGPIGDAPWYASRPVFFAMAGVTAGALLEIRNVRAIGPDGRDIVVNGDFADGAARWFSSSDKIHLPWHIKNLALDVLFDQGVIGLGLFALLAGGAFLRTTVGRGFRHPDAPYVAAGIAGYLVVGAFDSLLDVPRVAFAFYLVVLVGLMLRNPRVAGPVKVPSRNEAAAVVPEDEAAARAKRRQRAFGERVPLPR